MAHQRAITRQSFSIDRETNVEEPLKHNEASPTFVFNIQPIMEHDNINPGPFLVSFQSLDYVCLLNKALIFFMLGKWQSNAYQHYICYYRY